MRRLTPSYVIWLPLAGSLKQNPLDADDRDFRRLDSGTDVGGGGQLRSRTESQGFEPGLLNWVDFGGVASLIDTVAGAAPERLGLLLKVLSTSAERLEARVVVELTTQCRDPLAPLATLCQDALKTSTDLDALLKASHWTRVQDVCVAPRAQALLNLCDAALANDSPHHRSRRQLIRTIRPRVRLAAVDERERFGDQIAHQIRQREAMLPALWELLESFIANDRKSAMTPVPS